MFSPDGLTFASGSTDGTILLWDLRHALRRAATWGDIKESGIPNGTKPLSELSSSTASLTPAKSALLPNYPDPFNPETWIPYQLKTTAEVALTIYDMKGQAVRTLEVGHRPRGVYHSRDRAAPWDGRNQQGEMVANGVYFCKMTAGEFRGTQKMLIRK